MKKINLLYAMICALWFISCGGKKGTDEYRKKQFPKPGTTVATAQMPVTDDALNHFTFSVKIIADSDIDSGVYDVDVDYGPNFAEGKFTMPRGIEDIKPIIRKGSGPYTFIIGFHIPGDTTFNDYFQISSSKQNTRMEYIKAYTF